jgi:hypothetical protein
MTPSWGKEAITYDLHSFNCYLYENLALIIITKTNCLKRYILANIIIVLLFPIAAIYRSTWRKVVRDSSAVRRLFFIDLLEPWDVRELYLRKIADLPLQLCVDTFPRFVAIGFYFLFETLIQIASPIIFLFIHNHLTLRKWCYTPLQHDFASDHHFAMLTFIFEPTNVISRY